MTLGKQRAALELSSCSEAARVGSMDHILDVLASHNHPFMLVGNSAQRWMGSMGCLTDVCDMLVRDKALRSIASDLVETGHWEEYKPDPPPFFEPCPTTESDADLVLRRINPENENEYRYLCLWSESTYHIALDGCPTVEVPDVYPWQPILVEEQWHPAIHQDNGWWYGPRVHPDSNVSTLSRQRKTCKIFFEGLPRGRSSKHNHPILIPSLPIYLDALIYHETQYQHAKRGLWTSATSQLSNLTRYLYLELPHQRLPLLIELENYEFMEAYLEVYVRKPRFVYRKVPEAGFEATRVKEWDPTSFPDWCGTMR